jgi:hypothetical protein
MSDVRNAIAGVLDTRTLRDQLELEARTALAPAAGVAA